MTTRRPLPARGRRALAVATALAAFACAPQQEAGDGAYVSSSASGGASSSDPAYCSRIELLIDEAYRRNFRTEYASAEATWAQVASAYLDRDPTEICPDAPPRSLVMANQALVYSNQRKFVAAEGLFRAAAVQSQQEIATLDGDEARDAAMQRLAILRSLHNLNRAVTSDVALRRAEAEVDRLYDAPVAAAGNEAEFAYEGDLGTVLQLSPAAQQRQMFRALAEFSRSFVFMQEGDLPQAQTAIDSAMNIAAAVPGAESSFVPRFRTHKALLDLTEGNPAAALVQARAAADGFSEDFARSALRARALNFEAKALAELGRDDEALDTYAAAFAINETLAVPINYELVWPYFRLALKVIAERPERRRELTEAMFRAAQTVRSKTTAVSIANAAAAAAEGDDPEAQLRRDVIRARQEVSRLDARRSAMVANRFASTAETNDADEAFRKAVARLADLETQLRAKGGGLSDYGAEGGVDVAALRSVLAPDEVFVQILPGNPRSMAFAVTADDIFAEKVGENIDTDTLGLFIDTMRIGMSPAGIFPPNISNFIYEAYLQPIQSRFADVRRIVFATSGALASFPMEALAVRATGVADTSRRTDYTDVDWLGARHDISYVPGPQTLVDLRRNPAPKSGGKPRIKAYGDFVPRIDPDKVLPDFLPKECLPWARDVASLGALPDTGVELDAIRRVFGDRADLTEGEAFSEEAVKAASASGELARYDIVHFATHGVLPTDPQCLSEASLLATATGAPGTNGVLTESEIRRLDLKADLVVLTACDTAGFSNQSIGGAIGEGGEALSGLTRAFFDAGARAALVTHWQIPATQSSIDLVETFYRTLESGADFSASLRAAQDRLRADRESSDPFFWAAFVLVGDGSAHD